MLQILKRKNKDIFSIFFVFIWFFLMILQDANAVEFPPMLSFSPPPYLEQLYTIVLNEEDTHDIIHVLQDNKGDWWVPLTELIKWRMQRPAAPSISYQGRIYYRLKDIGGITYRVKPGEGKIYIFAEPLLFERYSLDFFGERRKKMAPEKSPFGGFLNYSLYSYKNVKIDAIPDAPTVTNGAVTLGIFDKFGVLTADLLLQNIGGTRDDISKNHLIRLDTVWTYDQPERMQSFRVGDTISASGMWGSALSIGGIQWERNFRTKPYFTKIPLPSTKGIAKLPSTVDIYINNVLRGQKKLPTGPFSIDNIPVITGQGNVRLVVTDILGKQQVITIPYYSDSAILKAGMHDFSIEAGFVRSDYGFESFKYGPFMLSFTDIYGVTDSLTSEIHTELSEHLQSIGVGANMVWRKYGVFTIAGAGSKYKSKFGGLALLGFTHNGDKINYGIRSKIISEAYRPLGTNIYYKIFLAPKEQHQAFISLSNVLKGSLGISYIAEVNRDSVDHNLLSASYSVGLFRKFSLSVHGVTSLKGKKTKQIYLTVMTNLNSRTYGSITASRWSGGEGAESNRVALSVNRYLPIGNGYGYRIKTATGNDANKYIYGNLMLQNRAGTYSFEASKYEGGPSNYEASISGGLAVLAGQMFLARKIYDSFAVVRIPDYPHTNIYLEHQKTAVTNKKGYALLPNLHSYIENHISIKPDELPLSANINEKEMIVVPYYRSGLFKKFDITKKHHATLTAKLPSGDYPPPGSIVKINDNKEDFYVASDGQIYVSGLKVNSLNEFKILLEDGSSCKFSLFYKPTKDTIPNLGEVICEKN